MKKKGKSLNNKKKFDNQKYRMPKKYFWGW